MSYDPFRRDTSEPKPREEIFVWSFVKDVRTFTGSLRAVDGRWEAVYLIDGLLYKTQVFATRVLAEHDLIRTRDALEATGWRPSGVNAEKGRRGGARAPRPTGAPNAHERHHPITPAATQTTRSCQYGSDHREFHVFTIRS